MCREEIKLAYSFILKPVQSCVKLQLQ